MPRDKFGGAASQLDSPATNHFAVTPANTGEFTDVARALYVGVGGDVSVVSLNDQTVVYKNAPSGTIIPIRCKRVNSTGTTATDIVGMF